MNVTSLRMQKGKRNRKSCGPTSSPVCLQETAVQLEWLEEGGEYWGEGKPLSRPT